MGSNNVQQFDWIDRELMKHTNDTTNDIVYYSDVFGLRGQPMFKDLALRFRFQITHSGQLFEVCVEHGKGEWPAELAIGNFIINDDKDTSVELDTTWRMPHQGDNVVGAQQYMKISEVIDDWFRKDGSLHVRCVVEIKTNVNAIGIDDSQLQIGLPFHWWKDMSDDRQTLFHREIRSETSKRGIDDEPGQIEMDCDDQTSREDQVKADAKRSFDDVDFEHASSPTKRSKQTENMFD